MNIYPVCLTVHLFGALTFVGAQTAMPRRNTSTHTKNAYKSGLME
jgi:hypothetical protein